MYRIIIIPGYQETIPGSEYHLTFSSSERIVCDHRTRKPVPIVSVCIDLEAVGAVYRHLEQLDWSQIVDLGKYNTVDDVEQIVFRGKFGQISLPLRYYLENKKLNPSEKNLCSTLLELLKTIEGLSYISPPDSPSAALSI